MVDRRFLDIRFTIKGFASKLDEGVAYDANDGEQVILSADLTSGSYAGAKKNQIAVRGGSAGWYFITPNEETSCEVINLETNEILKFDGSFEDDGSWKVVGYAGACVVPYVVDRAVSSHTDSAVQGKVGITYILPGVDNTVYKVVEGSTGYASMGTVSIGQKVAVVQNGLLYEVIRANETTKFSSSSDYAPPYSVFLSKYTQNLYVSSYSTGYDLVPVNQARSSTGEVSGTLCMERHVFTAAEIAAQEITLKNPVLENSKNSLVCFMAGGNHMYGKDFGAYWDSSSHLLTINWEDYSYAWYDSSPRAGEVAIFQYYKE